MKNKKNYKSKLKLLNTFFSRLHFTFVYLFIPIISIVEARFLSATAKLFKKTVVVVRSVTLYIPMFYPHTLHTQIRIVTHSN